MPRLIALRALLLIVVAIMVGRLYQLQLVESDSRRYADGPDQAYTRYVTVAPRRGEVFAADGTTLLAESVPTYRLAVVPGSLPDEAAEPERRAQVLARLSQVAELTSTLTLSPTSLLDRSPGLRDELAQIGPLPSIAASGPLTISIAPADTLRALDLVQQHGTGLTLDNPIEALIARESARGYQTVLVKDGIAPDLALAIKENHNYLPGVEVMEGFRRQYPASGTNPSLSHVLGYIGRISECELVDQNPASSWLTALSDLVAHAPVCGLIAKRQDPASRGLPPYRDDDSIGKDGLEAYYEAELRGQAGIQSVLVDARNRPVSDPTTIRPVENGHNLVLTLDTAFQQQTAHILQRWIDEGERRRQAAKEPYKRAYDPIVAGSAVVLDPRDGRVLAIVSLPSYDNNIWVDPARGAELTALLTRSDPKELQELLRLAPLTDRAIAGLYPPGSTLKQFVGATALQQGVIAADSKLRDPGLLQLTQRDGSPFVLPNSTRRDNGEITVVDALRVSSNVFFASIAGGNDQATNLGENGLRVKGLGVDSLAEGLEWFQFGRQTGIDLAGESAGLVPTQAWKAQVKREVWTTGDTYNTAIGQGDLQVTPLQLAVAAGGVALNGPIYRPHLVQRVVDGNGETVRTVEPELLSTVPIDRANFETIHVGLRDSVVNGLNIAAKDECSGLSIAGKTGTAEFGPLIPRTDGRLVRQSHSWFVGFAPYDDPQVVVAVLVEGTGDLGDGSSTIAVPAVTQIMQAYFKVNPPADAPRTCPVLPTDPPPPAPPAPGQPAPTPPAPPAVGGQQP